MTKARQLNVRIDDEDWIALSRAAELDRRSVGNVVRLILANWRRGRGAAQPATPSQPPDAVTA
jgi:hypothetical protein